MIQEVDKNKRRILISSLLIILAVVPARMLWLLYFPVSSIPSDSLLYFEPALHLINGSTPLFDIRNPGYPLFISLGLVLHKGLLGIIVLQSLLSIIGALWLNAELIRFLGRKGYAFTFALIVFLLTSEQVFHETAILSDSLFSALIMVNTALFIRLFRSDTTSTAVFLGLILGFTILVRPAGLFLLLPLAIYFMSKMKYWKGIKNLISPLKVAVSLLFMLFIFMTYNWQTIGSFSLSKSSALNFFGSTITYQKASYYPEGHIRELIDQHIKGVDKQVKIILEQSSAPGKIIPQYTLEYERMWQVLPKLVEHCPAGGAGTEQRISCIFPMIREASNKAILDHPWQFVRYHCLGFAYSLTYNRCEWKHGLVNLAGQNHSRSIRGSEVNSSDTNDLIINELIKRWEYDRQNAGLFISISGEENLNKDPFERLDLKDLPWVLYADQAVRQKLSSLLFFNKGYFWTIILGLCLLICLADIFIQRERKPEIYLLTILILSVLFYYWGSTALVYPSPRITYPLEWVKYFVFFWMIGVWLPGQINALRRP